MNLQTRKTELQRWGFSPVHEDEHSLVMVRSKWHWDIFITKLTVFAAVRKVSSLTLEQMRNDERYLKSQASSWDPSKLPPGFQKGRAYVVTYLVEEAAADAITHARSRPSIDLAAFYYPLVVLPSGQATYFDSNIAFGAAYFPLLRFFARRLAAPETPPPDREPLSWIGCLVTSMILLLLLLPCCGCLIFGALGEL